MRAGLREGGAEDRDANVVKLAAALSEGQELHVLY